LLEDEGLSLPATLNWTVMVRPNFESVDDGTTKTDAFKFADQVFMIGGRAGEHTGVFLEVGGGAYANAQVINSFDMGDNKAGVTVFSAGFGEDAGMQVMSVWGQHGGLLGGKSLSINNTMAGASGGPQNGVTLWAGSDAWVAQLGFVNATDAVEAGDPSQAHYNFAPVLRGNYFLEAGDWELGLGAIVVSGKSGANKTDQKRTGVDVQAFGEVGDMQIGVFADWATAPSSSNSNVYNASTTDSRTGYSLRATVKPTHNLIFLAGIGQDKTGAAKTDKTLVGVEYEMYQNGVINFTYGSEKAGGTTTKTTALEFELLI